MSWQLLGNIVTNGKKEAVTIDVDAVARRAADLVHTPTNGVDGKDGSSVTLDDIQPLISVEVSRAVAAEVAKAVSAVPSAKDGVGVVGALIDRSGHLVITLSDGTTKDIGLVVGQDADRAEIVRVITEEVAKFPKPKDGIDGKDGLGFDDMEPVFDEDGRLNLRFVRGDTVKTARVPGQVYRGVWVAGTKYLAGDSVTWGGSQWIAKQDTSAKPGETGEASRAWQLAVKAGRDGKGLKGDSGPQGPQGARGPEGQPGGRY